MKIYETNLWTDSRLPSVLIKKYNISKCFIYYRTFLRDSRRIDSCVY